MNKMNGGGPAFPCVDSDSRGYPECSITGMSLRDYFAAKAISEASALEIEYPTGPDGQPSYMGVATRAYLLADAMLAARGDV